MNNESLKIPKLGDVSFLNGSRSFNHSVKVEASWLTPGLYDLKILAALKYVIYVLPYLYK